MANLGMGWIYANQGKHQEALPYYERILEQKPSHILAILGKGNALFGLHRLDEAEAMFKQVLMIDPVNEYAIAELGMVAYSKGEDNYAEQLFHQAVQINNSTFTCPYEGLGLVYMRHGKMSEAEQNFEHAIEINPKIDYMKYNGLAKIYIARGQYQEAQELLHQSIENYPYDTEAPKLLKMLEMKTGKLSSS